MDVPLPESARPLPMTCATIMPTARPRALVWDFCDRKGGKFNRTAGLARAKLQPSKPDDAEWQASGLWPISCTTSRVVPAPGVALGSIFHNHDAKIKSQQRLLAVVLTMRMDHDWQPAGHPVADR